MTIVLPCSSCVQSHLSCVVPQQGVGDKNDCAGKHEANSVHYLVGVILLGVEFQEIALSVSAVVSKGPKGLKVKMEHVLHF